MERVGPLQATSELAGSAIDPRKLLYLATVIEEGSLVKAAKLLTLSQPALSKSMSRLEGELGRKLIERGPGGIVPTAFGEVIYAHARSIREEMGWAQSQIRDEEHQIPVVTVGTLPSLASNVVPLAVGKWRDRHPNVLLRIVEKVQIELLLGLLRCEFDFVIGQTEFYDVLCDGLKQRVLFRDRLSVFARREHQLFKSANLSWEDLAQYPWVCPIVGWPHRTALVKLLESQGLEPPNQLVECGSIDFTKSLVSSSDHLAMMPTHSVASIGSEPSIRPLAITVPALKRDIAVIFRPRSPLSPVCQDLISTIEAAGTELSSALA